jgi:MFS family permease
MIQRRIATFRESFELTGHAAVRNVLVRELIVEYRDLGATAIVLLMVAGTIRPWTIILLSVVVGVTDALSMPSFQSIVPSIVSDDHIGPGLALNSTQFNLSRILGPSLAGVLMSSTGAVACFVVSAVSYVPFIGVALWIIPRRSSAVRKADPPTWMQSFTGIGEIVRQRHLRGALLTVLITGVLCAPLITFSPVLVKDVFKGGAAHFSAAVASFGIGGLIGATGLLGIPAQPSTDAISLRDSPSLTPSY